MGEFAEALVQMQRWVDDGLLSYRICWYDDLLDAPEALNAMFTGANIGKILVRVGPDSL